MKKYTKVELICGSVLGVQFSQKLAQGYRLNFETVDGQVLDNAEGPLNSYLSKGWEIIEIIKHYSSKDNVTGLFYLMGLPPEK